MAEGLSGQSMTALPGAGRVRWPGLLLGFALGGFFDGILLHQILQWHHLLSGLEGEAGLDLPTQILWDGLFHTLMYILAAIGLVLLWRAGRTGGGRGADRLVLANLLTGFGVWHVLDSVVSHWLTGIHRIRMDSPNPLTWDLIWFFAFGVVPLLLGWMLRRHPAAGMGGHGRLTTSLLAVLVVGAGIAAALPARGTSQVMVWFGPGASPQAVFAAAAAVDARVVWSDRSGALWAFVLPDPARGFALYRHGALFVGNTGLGLGCLAWSKAS